MIICEHCGQIIEDGVNYCPNCGMRVDSGRVVPVHQARKKMVWFIFPAILALIFSTLLYRFYSTSRLEIAPTHIKFFKYGGEDIIEIDYDGFTWKVDKSPKWLELNTHDRRLLINALPNLTGHTRRDSIVISSGSLHATAFVTQLGTSTFMRLTQSADTVAAAGDTISVTFDCDGVAPVLTLPDYCHEIKRSDDEIFIAIGPNDTDKLRRARIVLTEDSCFATANFIQEPMPPAPPEEEK